MASILIVVGTLAAASLAVGMVYALRPRPTAMVAALIAVGVAFLAGLGGTILGLVVSFRSVGAVDAAHRAETLARGISEAMWATTIGLGTSVTIGALIAVGMIREKRASRPQLPRAGGV
jgi:hypothetical protein